MLMQANNAETVSKIENTLNRLQALFASGPVCSITPIIQAEGIQGTFSRMFQVAGILQKTEKTPCNRGWKWVAACPVTYEMAEMVYDCYRLYHKFTLSGINSKPFKSGGETHYMQISCAEKGYTTFEQWAKKNGITFPDFSQAQAKPIPQEPKVQESGYVTFQALELFEERLLGKIAKLLATA